MTGWNLPPGVTQDMIDRAFGCDEPDGESEFYCDACSDIGWLCEEVTDTVTVVVPCPECGGEQTLFDLEEDEA